MNKTTENATQKPLVFAHRGASGYDTQYAAENTLPAFEKAIEMGADGIETDVQLTKDGALVLCHDERIDRTSDGQGYIRDFTLKELREFSFAANHKEQGATQIPLLEELLALIAPTHLQLNIELKTGVIFYPDLERRTYELVEKYNLAERVIFSSFNHYSLKVLRDAAPDARIGLLMGQNFASIPDYPALFGAEALHPYYQQIDKNYVVKCHAHGLRVNTWTCDVKMDMKRLCDWGVDAFITDCPDSGRKIADGDYSIIPPPPAPAPKPGILKRVKRRAKKELVAYLTRE